MTESLSQDEMAFHVRVLADARAAQAVVEAWSRHLAAKYGLSGLDRVGESGAIERVDSN